MERVLAFAEHTRLTMDLTIDEYKQLKGIMAVAGAGREESTLVLCQPSAAYLLPPCLACNS